jgi:hypothetical protein
LILFSGGASKYGFMAGLYKSQLFIDRLDFHLEYAQVRKWTYTHVTHINNWQYEGQPFGFWLGPDADEFYTDLRYFITPVSSLNLGFNYVRKGEGDLFHPYEDTFGDRTPEFPSGNVEKGAGMWIGGLKSHCNFAFEIKIGYRKLIHPLNLNVNRNSLLLHINTKILI